MTNGVIAERRPELSPEREEILRISEQKDLTEREKQVIIESIGRQERIRVAEERARQEAIQEAIKSIEEERQQSIDPELVEVQEDKVVFTPRQPRIERVSAEALPVSVKGVREPEMVKDIEEPEVIITEKEPITERIAKQTEKIIFEPTERERQPTALEVLTSPRKLGEEVRFGAEEFVKGGATFVGATATGLLREPVETIKGAVDFPEIFRTQKELFEKSPLFAVGTLAPLVVGFRRGKVPKEEIVVPKIQPQELAKVRKAEAVVKRRADVFTRRPEDIPFIKRLAEEGVKFGEDVEFKGAEQSKIIARQVEREIGARSEFVPVEELPPIEPTARRGVIKQKTGTTLAEAGIEEFTGTRLGEVQKKIFRREPTRLEIEKTTEAGFVFEEAGIKSTPLPEQIFKKDVQVFRNVGEELAPIVEERFLEARGFKEKGLGRQEVRATSDIEIRFDIDKAKTPEEFSPEAFRRRIRAEQERQPFEFEDVKIAEDIRRKAPKPDEIDVGRQEGLTIQEFAEATGRRKRPITDVPELDIILEQGFIPKEQITSIERLGVSTFEQGIQAQRQIPKVPLAQERGILADISQDIGLGIDVTEPTIDITERKQPIVPIERQLQIPDLEQPFVPETPTTTISITEEITREPRRPRRPTERTVFDIVRTEGIPTPKVRRKRRRRLTEEERRRELIRFEQERFNVETFFEAVL